MTMEHEYETKEKQQMADEYRKSQERLYTRGKIIVFIIASMNILSTIITFFTDFNFIKLIVQIALSIALFCGISWVRYFFAIGTGLAFVFCSYMLLSGAAFSTVTVSPEKYLLLLYLVLNLCYSLISCILLLKSKSIAEFLYSQKNG